MKTLGSIILGGFMIISCNQNQGNIKAPISEQTTVETINSVRDGVFIHITECYDDPHRVLMPLKMAVMMSADKDVIVYMDIHAVQLLVKGAKDMRFADFESAQTYIKQLTEKGDGVYACPTCLKIAGYQSYLQS